MDEKMLIAWTVLLLGFCGNQGEAAPPFLDLLTYAVDPPPPEYLSMLDEGDNTFSWTGQAADGCTKFLMCSRSGFRSVYTTVTNLLLLDLTTASDSANLDTMCPVATKADQCKTTHWEAKCAQNTAYQRVARDVELGMWTCNHRSELEKSKACWDSSGFQADMLLCVLDATATQDQIKACLNARLDGDIACTADAKTFFHKMAKKFLDIDFQT